VPAGRSPILARGLAVEFLVVVNGWLVVDVAHTHDWVVRSYVEFDPVMGTVAPGLRGGVDIR
jgi:hypothetical protein